MARKKSVFILPKPKGLWRRSNKKMVCGIFLEGSTNRGDEAVPAL